MRDVTSRMYIVSTYKQNRSEQENYTALVLEGEHLKIQHGLQYNIAIGQHENVIEHSLVVYGDNNAEAPIAEIAKAHGQASYIIVYNDGNAEFVYADGTRENKGTWTPTNDLDAAGLTIIHERAYTIIETQQRRQRA